MRIYFDKEIFKAYHSLPESLQKDPSANFYAKFAINIKRGRVDSKPSTNNKDNKKDSDEFSESPKKKSKGIPTATFSLNRRGTAENPIDLTDLPGFEEDSNSEDSSQTSRDSVLSLLSATPRLVADNLHPSDSSVSSASSDLSDLSESLASSDSADSSKSLASSDSSVSSESSISAVSNSSDSSFEVSVIDLTDETTLSN